MHRALSPAPHPSPAPPTFSRCRRRGLAVANPNPSPSPDPGPDPNQVQRGLAIASQTLASELSIKCERLQARLEMGAPGGANGGGLQPPTPMATPSALMGGGSAYGGCGGAQYSYPPHQGAGAGAASPAPSSLQTPSLQALQTPSLQSQQLQQLQARSRNPRPWPEARYQP